MQSDMALRRIPYTHTDDGYSLNFTETVSLPKQEGCRQVLWALSAKGKAGYGRILFGNMMRRRLMSKTVSQRLVVLSVRGMAGRMGGYAPLPGKASSSDSFVAFASRQCSKATETVFVKAI